jgi:hypothetical protein
MSKLTEALLSIPVFQEQIQHTLVVDTVITMPALFAAPARINLGLALAIMVLVLTALAHQIIRLIAAIPALSSSVINFNLGESTWLISPK